MLNGLLAFGRRIYYNEENKNESGAMNAGGTRKEKRTEKRIVGEKKAWKIF